MKDNKWKHYYWLNLQDLCEKYLLGYDDDLIEIKYFSAELRHDKQRYPRQKFYLRALSSCPKLQFYPGNFQPKDCKCLICKNVYRRHVEKRTDVNIASEMMADAFTGKFDKAILLSADSDLSAPLMKIRDEFDNKPDRKILVVALPPARIGYPDPTQLRTNAHQSFKISEDALRNCQFTHNVTTKDGSTVHCPDYWK